MKPTLRELQNELYELKNSLEETGGLEELNNLFELLKNEDHEETLEELKRLENEGKTAQGLIDLGRAITLSKQAIKERDIND